MHLKDSPGPSKVRRRSPHVSSSVSKNRRSAEREREQSTTRKTDAKGATTGPSTVSLERLSWFQLVARFLVRPHAALRLTPVVATVDYVRPRLWFTVPFLLWSKVTAYGNRSVRSSPVESWEWYTDLSDIWNNSTTRLILVCGWTPSFQQSPIAAVGHSTCQIQQQWEQKTAKHRDQNAQTGCKWAPQTYGTAVAVHWT